MLLDTLTEPEKRAVVTIGHKKTFQKEEPIVREGDRTTALLFLLSGQAQARKNLDGDRYKQLRDFKPGDFFGDMSFLTSSPRSADVVALEESEVLELPRGELDKLIVTQPLIGMKIYRNIAIEIAARLRRNNDELKKAVLWALGEMDE